MTNQYEIASGSVTGTDHVHAGRGNQDARCVRQTPEFTVAVVADGCSDGAHSEVGAHIGANMAASIIARHVMWGRAPGQGVSWGDVNTLLVDALNGVAVNMGAYDASAARRIVNEFLLFTLVAIVITPDLTEITTIGDGFAALNGTVMPTAKYGKNMPPYIGYKLTTSTIPEEQLRWNVIAVIPTEYVDTFAIGTDGVDDLMANEQAIVPGRVEVVGPLSQFHEDRYYRNADMVRRRLAIINGGVGATAQRGGWLHDDTTLVVGRRSACSR